MKNKQIIELLKSGDFTIAYHDNAYCTLHKGKHEYEDCTDENEVAVFGGNGNGYLPEEVELLVKALGGKAHTI